MSDTAPFRPPLALHEAAVERLYARSPKTSEIIPDDALAAAVTALRTARTTAETIAATAVALHADPSRSGPAVQVELARTVPRIAERSTLALDGAAARLRRELAGLEETMAPAPPKSPEALALASELRTALRAMGSGERSKLLSQAIDAGDEAVISAVLRGSPLLSGLTPEMYGHLRLSWAAARHPEASARAGRLGQALEAVERAGAAAVDHARAVATTPGTAATVAAADAADAALAAARRVAE